MSSQGDGLASPEELSHILKRLIPEGELPVMTVRYTQSSGVAVNDNLANNICLCQLPDAEIGYAKAIERAKASFARLFSDVAFFPASQTCKEDPDDIDLGA